MLTRIRAPLIFCALVVLIGIFLSEYLNLFALWSEYDTLLHFLGGVGIAWLALAALGADLEHLAVWKQVLLFVSVTALVGLLWEFAEFLANFLQYSAPWFWYWFHGGSIQDTLLDLVADIVGAVLFTLWALRRRAKSAPASEFPAGQVPA